ncbi:MAG: dynamin family protein [Bacteroidales bacterium]|nr:dynamin family protein [Bacteroidales bacterium]
MAKELDLYAALFKAKKEMAALAKDDFEYGDAYKTLETAFYNSRPVVADKVYSLCNRVEDMLYLLSDSMRQDCGIRTKNRPVVLLTGEFSTGKTTLIQEFTKEKSGTISPIPETANIVVHKSASESSCEIFFNKKFRIAKSEDFRKFLHTFDIDIKKNFVITDGEYWNFVNDSVVKSSWKSNEIQEFMYKTKDYPEAFATIIWAHDNCPDYSPLNYTYLVDMPGTGGNEAHENVIDRYFECDEPDIVCYLIDTDNGIPGKVAEDGIKKIANLCLGRDIQFFWLYAKPSANSEQDINNEVDNNKDCWLSRKHKEIVDFVDAIYKGQQPDSITDTPNRDATVDENFIKKDSIDDEKSQLLQCAEMLKNAPIIDARNRFDGKENCCTAHAINAFAMVIQQYYIKILQTYTDALLQKLSQLDVPDSFRLIYKPSEKHYDILKRLFERIDDVLKNNITNVDCIKESIKVMFDIKPVKDIIGESNKVTVYLENLYKRIDSLIDVLLNKYTNGIVKKTFNLNEFYRKYKEDLKERTPENLLFYDVQVFHWFKLFYSGQVTNAYTKGFSDSVYHKLMALLDELKEDQTSILYIWK